MNKLSDNIERKFIDSIDLNEWEIETENGFVEATHIHKTIEYRVFSVTLENGLTLDCADDHILMAQDGSEVFAKDSQGVMIKTRFGASRVVSVADMGYSECMYDVTVNSDEHTYYTNDILSHNTTTNAAYVLWYILTNKVKTVAILAHKASGAREVLDRVKQMYEALPLWLQQGVKVWNKGSIELGNDSAVIAAATTSSAIRGLTISFLLLDEFAFIPSNNAQSFFDSVYPTISSGTTSKISIFSTPNGMNHFYKMWMEATEGKIENGVAVKSEFAPMSIAWNDVPGRDDEFRRKTIATIGEASWNQEYDCITGDSIVTIRCQITGEIYDRSINDLIGDSGTFEVLTHEGFKPFHGISNHGFQKCLLIETLNSRIKCTFDHLLNSNGVWIEADSLNVGDYLTTKEGNAQIVSITEIGEHEVFDLMEVQDTHSFYANGILVHNCHFLGSVGTLISSSAISNIPIRQPIVEHPHLKIYEEVQPDRTYLITVDVARGGGGDYSVVLVTDITSLPYKQVAVYRNNELSYMLLPGVIYELGKKYNEAFVLIELNDNGEAVADDLFHNLEYENVLTTGGKGQKVVLGSWINSKNGVRTTKSTKRQGCSIAKAMIENVQYLVYDYDTVEEMANFVAKGASYEAEQGSTDDIMMTLVIFAWASNQPFFQELCSTDFKKRYIEDSHEHMIQELSPIGYFHGVGDDDDNFILT